VKAVEDGYAVLGSSSQAIIKAGLQSDPEADVWIDGFGAPLATSCSRPVR
jgi:hypothetical protein